MQCTSYHNFLHQKIPYLHALQENREMGARYLDPKYSRWISVDPALGEYVPQAPVNDEAKKQNQNLPGMGGVFNGINLNLFHYAGNNPVRYIDPDGKFQIGIDGGYIFLPEVYPDGHELSRIEKGYQIKYGLLVANDGTKIRARYKVQKNIYPGDNFDCHGYTFTDGCFWIDDDAVEAILKGDGYKVVVLPSPGDIMIQRDQNGNIIHSAKVLYYDREANSVYVSEAMGNAIFVDRNGEYCKTRMKFYNIDRNLDSFYSPPQNVIVEKTPNYTMEEFYEIWKNL